MKYTKVAAVAAGTLMAIGAATPAFADSGAETLAQNSSGVLSGNVFQLPISNPLNACGNTVGVTGLLNPAYGNSCSGS